MVGKMQIDRQTDGWKDVDREMAGWLEECRQTDGTCDRDLASSICELSPNNCSYFNSP